MKTPKLIFVAVFLCAAVSSVFAQLQKLRINLDDAMGGKVSDFFDQIEYIPLETTTTKSLIAFVDDLQISDKYIVVLDRSQKSIFIFLGNGKFKAKISDQGGIPRMYFDKKKDIIYYFRSNKRFATFQYSINSEETVQSHKSVMDSVVYFSKFDNGNILYQTSPFANEKNKYELGFCKDSITEKYELPVIKEVADNDRFSQFQVFNGNNNHIIFNRNFDYNTYGVEENGKVDTLFTFLFPLQYTFPSAILNDSSQYGKLSSFIRREENKDYISRVANVYKSNQFLYFRLIYGSINNERNYDYFYDFHSGNTFAVSKILPDTLSGNFSITDYGFGINMGNYGFSEYKNYLYTTVDGYSMYKIYDMLKESGRTITSPVLLNFFKQNTIKKIPNPVIVKVKLR